ncbi:MAG: hypothetical protein AAF716_01555 [Cyanobacteria bacterium P01_D01_bin.1]
MSNLFRRFFNIFRQPAHPEVSDVSEAADSTADLSLSSRSTADSPNSLPAASVTTQPSSDSRIENLKQVVNVLRAYSVTFGQPENELELRAVVGAIAASVATVQIENSKLEPFIDEAAAAYNSLGTDASLVDVGAQLLAEKASVWLKEQESAVSNIMNAYLQQFAPDDAQWQTSDVVGLARTIIATLNDGSLSRSGGKELIKRVVSSFDLERALSRWVAPEWIALAQRVASYAEKGDLQSELQSIAWAYVQQFQSILSPQLIEQIMQEGSINVSASEFMSGDLSDFSKMLYYKFQLLEADPVVTKSHEQIAADVHRAVEAFRERNKVDADLTMGVQDGDLSISSPFFN